MVCSSSVFEEACLSVQEVQELDPSRVSSRVGHAEFDLENSHLRREKRSQHDISSRN